MFPQVMPLNLEHCQEYEERKKKRRIKKITYYGGMG